MKKIYSFFIFILFPLIAVSQYGPQQIISTTANGADKVYAADLSGNGFNDVIVLCSNPDYQIIWYENLDGNGNFGPATALSDTPAFFLYFEAVDINSNGHLDILYLENNPRRLVWKENLDGSGNFGPEQVILENQTAFLMEVKTFDLNNDSHPDIVIRFSNSFFEDHIVWYENLNGSGSFSEPILLINNITEATGPLIIDIDNDGLPDLLLAYNEYNPAGKLVWYKNLGNQTFGVEQLIYQFDFFMSDWTRIINIKVVDINTNGKNDIVITSHNDDTGTFLHLIENIDNLGTFSDLMPVNISSISFDFYDLDNDGDMDVLIYNRFSNSITWQKNISGDGVFSSPMLVSSDVLSLRHAIAANIKDNGELEVISASFNDNKVAWYEFLGLNTEEFEQAQLNIYPNPGTDFITIQSPQSISTLSLYDIQGKKLDINFDGYKIDISNLSSGVYFLKVSFENHSEVTKKIIKQ